MKLLSISLLAFVMASCHQKTTLNTDSQIMDMEVRTMSDTAKSLLIDISNNAWFQAQIAQLAATRVQDTSLLSMAQNVSKQYTHIKERAKIVSVPYKLNMPYFLRQDQNIRVKELNESSASTFKKDFLDQLAANNQNILKECNELQPLVKDDSNIVHFIAFSSSIVEDNQVKLQNMK